MNIAVAQRMRESVIRHSDQGSLYISVPFGLRCKELGLRSSAEIRVANFEIIGGCYNPSRRHSALGSRGPINF